jgi:hypothetical protein
VSIESCLDRPAQKLPRSRVLTSGRYWGRLYSSAPGVSQRKRARFGAILGGDGRAESGVSEIKLLSQVLQDVCIALLHRGNRAVRRPRVDSMNRHREPLVCMEIPTFE